MKNIFKIVLVALVALFLGACSDNEKPKEQEKQLLKLGQLQFHMLKFYKK